MKLKTTATNCTLNFQYENLIDIVFLGSLTKFRISTAVAVYIAMPT